MITPDCLTKREHADVPQAHWIPQLIGLSAEAIQFVTGPWAGNGQINQRSSDGQTDEWLTGGQAGPKVAIVKRGLTDQ